MKFVLGLAFLWASFCHASYVHFDHVDEFGNKKRIIQFRNTKIVKDFYENKITYSEFTDIAFANLEEDLKRSLDCGSLTDETTAKECVDRLLDQDINLVDVSHPYFSHAVRQGNERLEKFNDDLREDLKKKIEELGIHESINEVFQYEWPYTYSITANTYFSPERALIVRETLGLLKSDHKQPECTVEALENTLSLNETNSSREAPFNTEKCNEYMLKLSWTMDGFYSFNDRDSGWIIPIPAVHEKYIELIEEEFSLKDASEIISSVKVSYYEKGKTYDISYSTLYGFLLAKFRSMTYPQLDLKDLIEFVRDTEPVGKVNYDGVLGVHKYLEANFRAKTVSLGEKLMKDTKEFSDFVINNNLKEIFVDTNTTEESSRLEPIDLISNYAYRQIKSINDRLGANFKNFLKKAINHYVGLEENIEDPIYFIPKQPRDSNPRFICIENRDNLPEETSRNLHDSFFKMIYGNTISPDVPGDDDGDIGDIDPERLNSDTHYQNFTCSDKEYKIEYGYRNEAPLKLPKAFMIDDGFVDILMPYAMTNELNETFKKLAKLYFSGLRYKIETKPLADVPAYIKAEMVNADVLMPAGHSLASRNLHIGTKSGELYTFTREKRRGEKYGVRFHITLPDKKAESASIALNELAESYVTRIQQGQDPLMVFVVSCWSQNNIFDWSLIYRKSVSLHGEDPALVPYVMASTRGFPTSSNTDIASSVFYPSDVADFLARGDEPKDVYEILKEKKYHSIARELIERVGAAWFYRKNNNWEWLGDIFKKPEEDQFKPIYNLSEEQRNDVLRRAGVQYKMYEDGELIYDQTF